VTGVARRKAALAKVATARGVLSGLRRSAIRNPPVDGGAQIAHHRLLLAAYRALSHALAEVAPLYRPDSPTQRFVLGEHQALNIVVATLHRQLDAVGGGC
jgi:hypothetical protein